VRTQVIIVGAGPTGLSLACQLTRFGVGFVIVEKNAGITPYSKALGVHARTLEIYDQLGIANAAVTQGAVAGKVRFLVGGEVRGEADLSDFGAGMSPFPFVLILEQSRNERLLYAWLAAHGGAVQWNNELQHFSQDAHGVRATVKTPDGDRTIDAEYLVGCDGPRSAVRDALGLGFAGSTFERSFYVADVRVDWAMSHDALHICFAPNSFVLFFPMAGECRYRVVGVFPEDFRKDEGEVLYEEIEARVKTEVQIPLDVSDVRWFSVYKVHTRHAESFSAGRCFLAGDAAHIHSPVGAQGMNTGIQDAYNLAWKLAFVLQGRAHPAMLASYDEERLANAKRLLRTTDRMFELGAGQGALLGFVRTQVFPPFAHFVLSRRMTGRRLFPLLSQIGIRYRDSRLADHEGDTAFRVKAGDRMPYLVAVGENLYHRLRAPTFHCLSFGASPDDDAGDGGVVWHRLPLDERVAEIFGFAEPFHVLLRPDHYIAWLGREASAVHMRHYLERLRGEG
jgi:2-polyprenyl-6-methoxyphenol hydroxylase-like FAD-dependent oxidoreductase